MQSCCSSSGQKVNEKDAIPTTPVMIPISTNHGIKRGCITVSCRGQVTRISTYIQNWGDVTGTIEVTWYYAFTSTFKNCKLQTEK